MKADDIELMAYVDDALDARDRTVVERAIERSADFAQRVAWLEASRLPYADAFAASAAPPVPPRLSATIGAIAARGAGHAVTTPRPFTRGPVANDPHIEPLAPFARSDPPRRAWLAIALAAGACAGVLVRSLVRRRGGE